MRLTLVLCAFAILPLAACGSSDETAGSAGTAGTAADRPDSGSEASSPETAEAADIAGRYTVTGTNADGSAYTGTLTVASRGSAYDFAWEGNQSYTGVGVKHGDYVAAGYGGAECGAALYHVSDGLDGVWAVPGADGAGTERAARTSGTAGEPAGRYDVTGANPDGSAYSGTLEVEARGTGYTLTWGGNSPSSGLGLSDGDELASSYGAEGCSSILYHVQPDGRLVGTWADAGGSGTEQAAPM